jgi:EmrB/QacA subfamily drug resistance transporter
LEYKWTVLTVTTIGILMAGIDSRIVVIGLPTVANALRADAEEAIWFTQSYVLGSTVSLLLLGRVTDIIGRIKVYNIGFVIFTIGSALTSISQDPLQVIVFRGVQGIGAAALFTNSIVMIVDATPRNQLGLFLGLNQIAFRFGAMAGLTISGIILSFFDWRALFYINVPIGIFGTLWSRYRLKEIAVLEKGAPVDWIGFATLTTSVTAFLLALTFGAYGLLSADISVALLILSLTTLGVFLQYERRCAYPLIDLSLFRVREFTGGIVALMINGIAWGAVLLLLSLYLQLVLGYGPFEAGIRIIPFDVAFLLVGPLSGRLSDRYGPLLFTMGGIILNTAGLFLLSLVDAHTPYWILAVYMMILAAGTGAFVSPNTSAVMGSVPPHRRGIASGVRGTVFNIGFTVSINLAILLMATVAPYSLISRVIASNGALIGPGSIRLFVESLQKTYIWLAVINATAIIPSLLRGGGRRRPDEPKDAPTVATE